MYNLYAAVNEDFYVRHYKINPALCNNHNVCLVAECSKNPYYGEDPDYYHVDFLFSVDEYGALDYILGTSFGDKKMQQHEVELQIQELIPSALGEDFFRLVEDYLAKEKLWESYLDSSGQH